MCECKEIYFREQAGVIAGPARPKSIAGAGGLDAQAGEQTLPSAGGDPFLLRETAVLLPRPLC